MDALSGKRNFVFLGAKTSKPMKICSYLGGGLTPPAAGPTYLGGGPDPLAAESSYLGGGSTHVLSFIPPPGSKTLPPLE